MNNILLAGTVMTVANHVPLFMVAVLLPLTVVFILIVLHDVGEIVYLAWKNTRTSHWATEEAIEERVSLTIDTPWYAAFVRACMGPQTKHHHHWDLVDVRKAGAANPHYMLTAADTGSMIHVCPACLRYAGFKHADDTMEKAAIDNNTLERVHKGWSFCGCCQAAASKRAADTMDSLDGWVVKARD